VNHLAIKRFVTGSIAKEAVNNKITKRLLCRRCRSAKKLEEQNLYYVQWKLLTRDQSQWL